MKNEIVRTALLVLIVAASMVTPLWPTKSSDWNEMLFRRHHWSARHGPR